MMLYPCRSLSARANKMWNTAGVSGSIASGSRVLECIFSHLSRKKHVFISTIPTMGTVSYDKEHVNSSRGRIWENLMRRENNNLLLSELSCSNGFTGVNGDRLL